MSPKLRDKIWNGEPGFEANIITLCLPVYYMVKWKKKYSAIAAAVVHVNQGSQGLEPNWLTGHSTHFFEIYLSGTIQKRSTVQKIRSWKFFSFTRKSDMKLCCETLETSERLMLILHLVWLLMTLRF